MKINRNSYDGIETCKEWKTIDYLSRYFIGCHKETEEEDVHGNSGDWEA